MSISPVAPAGPSAEQRTFLGHPLGLYVLFFTEMWERFSYYGMRALLVLYMLDHFKWSQREASTVYKWYTSLVYLTPLLGGYLADRYLGNKRAVIIGAVLMAVGQFLLTFEHMEFFFAALVFLIFGNGFFKPNMSTQVGRLYPPNDLRLDGAYTIFYMGINLGAFLSPLVCGWLAANTLGGRHTGFMAAGIGMLLGLAIYLIGLRWVIERKSPADSPAATNGDEGSPAPIAGSAISEANAEQTPSAVPSLNRLSPGLFRLVGYALLIGALALGAMRGTSALLAARRLDVPPFLQTMSLADYVANNTLISLAIVALCALIAGWILGRSRQAMRDRVLTIYVLGVFVVFFWAAFEQAGNALNVWADKATNRYLTRPAQAPPLFPEKPHAPAAEQVQEGQEATVASDNGWSRWFSMWRLKPGKAADSTKKGGRESWFVDLWNPVATEWFQSINALAIFVLAPLFAWMWTTLDRRGLHLSVPAKMGIGVLLMSLAFGLMILAAQREDGVTEVPFNGPLPSQIKLGAGGLLCGEEDHEVKEYQAGRLSYDANAHLLHMRGVLADTERDRMVRDTAPESFVQAVKDLQQKSVESAKNHRSASVVLDPPAGFDMRYAGLDDNKIRYDDKTHTLRALNFELKDKDVKSLLVAAGEPAFRDAVNKLYQESARHRVSPWWLFWFYIIATLAELCLSPVGLSMVSKLAPAKFATMLMGLWLLTSFFGNFAAGAFGERWGEWTPTEYFLYIMALLGAASVVLFLLVRKIGAMMHGVREQDTDMTRSKTWTLTDVQGDVWLDSFAAGNDTLHLPTPFDWSLRKRTLRGGLRDGVDLIEVHNGALAFSILPTRGMALWRGDYHGNPLGWRSPLVGPVHPKYVQLADRGGLGWLNGFDELLCRCGLSSNGSPGNDDGTPLTLHGRIANLPAQMVEVRVNLDPPYELSVAGEVDESALFSPQFRLATTYTTIPGSNRLVIHDVVTNRAARPVEMQLLYHCNLGPPFLEAGSRVLVPIREMAPQTPRAAEGIAAYETYAAPLAGFAEQVYLFDPLADARGQTLALLVNASADRAVAVRYNVKELPCFTVWKNTGAIEEGYVTGLEPATNYPNFKSFERRQGRVPMLSPGGRWECRWMLEIADNAPAVSALMAEVAALQAHARAVIHRAPQPRFSPT